MNINRIAANLAHSDAAVDIGKQNRLAANAQQSRPANDLVHGSGSGEKSLPSDPSALESMAATDEGKAIIAKVNKFVDSSSKSPAIREAKDAFSLLDKYVGELPEAKLGQLRDLHQIDLQFATVLLR